MKESAYKQAGVDIEEAAGLIERIKPLARATQRSGVMAGLGGFGALFDLKQTGFKDPVLVSSTDGVGTKIKIAIDLNRHDTIGIDAVAMCVNDIIVQGAEPLFFLDYFATGKLVNNTAEKVIAGIAEGCRQSNCALIGGETAEMPGLYADGDYDIAGFCVGAVERERIITGETMQEGDIILALASSGVHSNGYSLVRKLIADAKMDYDDAAPFDQSRSLADILLAPTRIYVRPVLEALKIEDGSGRPSIRGMAHITGGGLYENIPRVVPDGLCAMIDAESWDLPCVFKFLANIGGVDFRDMLTTLNCGIGMAIVCNPLSADKVAASLQASGETVFKIGRIAAGQKGGERIHIQNIDTAWRQKN